MTAGLSVPNLCLSAVPGVGKPPIPAELVPPFPGYLPGRQEVLGVRRVVGPHHVLVQLFEPSHEVIDLAAQKPFLDLKAGSARGHRLGPSGPLRDGEVVLPATARDQGLVAVETLLII